MKFLKTIGFVFSLSLIGFHSHGQNFGLKAGLSVSTFHYFDSTDFKNNNFRSLYGFHVGPIFEIPMGKVMSIETGAILTQKGAVYDITTYDFDFWEFSGIENIQHSVYNLYYIDIPLQIKATATMGDSRLFFGAGGFFGIGLTGNVYTEYSTGLFGEMPTEIIRRDQIQWGKNPDMGDVLKDWNYGVMGSLGFEYKSIFIEGSYSFGFANTTAEKDAKLTISTINASVGYRFRTDKK